MKTEYSPGGRIVLLFLLAIAHSLLIGCNDDSKTSGTMVKVSDEEKAYLKTKRESYKAAVPKNRPKAIGKK